jgi:hypothetical protein
MQIRSLTGSEAIYPWMSYHTASEDNLRSGRPEIEHYITRAVVVIGFWVHLMEIRFGICRYHGGDIYSILTNWFGL